VTSSVPPTVGILGAGYVGIGTGLAFAHYGCRVSAFDSNPTVATALRQGKIPYREAGLEALLRTAERRQRFEVVDSMGDLVGESAVIFVCLPTPRGPSGRIDLGPICAALPRLGSALARASGYRLVVVKSTVVPGTTEEVLEPLLRETSGRPPGDLGIAVNPEFLAEGSMVRDALHPSRIVIGVSDARSGTLLRRAYARFPAPVFELSPSGAELVKYAANVVLAAKVSFANEVARLSDRLGENIDRVMQAVGADPRIGSQFLHAGPGFGGSCFDKDVRALVHRAEELGLRFRTGEAALAANDDQIDYVLGLITRAGGPLRGTSVALLGLAFKAGTDDVRESRAIPIARRLVAQGARVRLTDPVALERFRREWGPGSKRVTYHATAEEALTGADVAVLQADWPEYRRWPRAWTAAMHRPLLIDLRRAVSPAKGRAAGLEVVQLGVGPRERLPGRPAP
jgi:UDPglucose 6-dehydrogenase